LFSSHVWLSRNALRALWLRGELAEHSVVPLHIRRSLRTELMRPSDKA
jgi:hypothetical protein